MNDAGSNRRPIKARSSMWAQKAASFLAKTGVSPNQISVASVFFAAIGAALLVGHPTSVGLLGCAVAIQGRLVCNLLDGMVAIEEGKQSPLGQLFNEFPDRIADAVLIVALGYAIDWPAIGWLGALAAISTAYVRAFGGSLGLAQDFRGPMAKPHRMAVMTGGCVLGAIEQASVGTTHVLMVACIVIAFGSLATCVTRSRAMAVQLRQNEL
ncbi:MAG: CDP-alcohol phosphatidyltransferase family protein [Gammaproteobacteria bacterium]|nr:CDP-alcohol phosphatidyltransferase family protein [Gammaproteobacteria bacterium]